ncbi:MAG TPA: hypothetical protein VL977_03360 [Solirubrobacteraceae bacterium]|nr:hypothetical protein [Solirubrobacteraceae bacterium]
MADDDVEGLNDRLISDPDLRQRFQEDPAGVVREAGIDLRADQEDRLTAAEWHEKSDDEMLAALEDEGLAAWL